MQMSLILKANHMVKGSLVCQSWIMERLDMEPMLITKVEELGELL